MITIKSHTDLPQSKKLAEFLPIKSADMGWYYSRNPQVARNQMWVGTKAENADIPCWSLATLLDILPPIEGFRPIIDLDINSIRYEGNYRDELCFNGNNLVDVCYEMVIELHEKGLL